MKKIYITDSRSLSNPLQTIFVAVKTRSGNGHNYIRALFEKGVREFIISEKVDGIDAMQSQGAIFYKVPDTLEELRSRAKEKINKSNIDPIAIIGSRGKTLIKEWLYRLIKDKSERGIRSYNSFIGVPLSILNQEFTQAKYFITEVGISKEGEMSLQESYLKPAIVILTNITTEHDDGFLSRQHKIHEKLLLSKEAESVVYPGGDSDIENEIIAVEKERERKFIKYIWNVEDNSIIITINEPLYPNCRTITYNTDSLKLPDVIKSQKFWKENIAVLIASLMAIEKDSFVIDNYAFESLTPLDVKLTVHEGSNYNKIIVDTFAVDGQSIEPSLDFMRRIASNKNKLLVIVITDNRNLDIESIQYKIHQYSIPDFLRISRKEDLRILERNNVEKFKDFTILILTDKNNDYEGELLSYFETRLYETTMEVNLDSIIKNYNFFKTNIKPETGIICMLKAFGYGVGSIELARTLQNQGARALAVAVIDEGIILRKNNITCPIMILNPQAYNYTSLFENDLEPVIYNFELLDSIIMAARKLERINYPIHIKLETGMRRLGFQKSEIPALILRLKEYSKYLKVKSVMSHLAAADCPQLDDFTISQIQLFENITNTIESGLNYSFKRHILNSAGILRFPEAQFDMVRLGIGLYGVATVDKAKENLAPVATVYSSIISLKLWKAGDTIGYGCRGVLTRDSMIATIPIGYADGLDRRLGNGNGYVIVNGSKCPIVGAICMDICMIDVTDIHDCRIGTRVEILGKHIPVTVIAEKLQTIPYEILTSISHRVKRIYYRES